ncbi:MAG: hypothetical protein OXE53_00310 [Deltaproteobacteria bacterium]|nr:hypothetical protein [Deltaproteobacteria bacterium]
MDLPSGCRFRDRCFKATGICAGHEPTLEEKARNQWVACYRTN